jgi:capsid protein
MKILGLEIKRSEPIIAPIIAPVVAEPEDLHPDQSEVEARYAFGNYYPYVYNGEKNLGEIGPIKEMWLDYAAISARSWQAMLESDVTRMIIRRFVMWVIGDGLKLQSEPNKRSLLSEKINIDSQEFSDLIEARFSVFAGSKTSSYNGQKTLYALQKEAYNNACVSGDVLVIQRFDGFQQSIQLVDGCHMITPFMSYGGNKVENGIETNSKGEHVAYWIKDENCKEIRVPAKNSIGLRTAWLVYGDIHRIDDNRGVSRVITVLETLAQVERYKSATVGSAEEQAKISYQVVHQQYSTGENPQLAGVAKAFNTNRPVNPATINGEELANKVIATTNKQSINMPVGAEVKPMHVSNNTLAFKDFFITLVECVCGVVGIPPNVAMSKYDASYSASRAGLKDWEHTLMVERKEFSTQFMGPIYEYFLFVQVITGKVQAEGYLQGFFQKNIYIYEAYQNSKFVGANVPHIDPVKEVTAERLKLGDAGANIPLTTAEEATEVLGNGSAKANTEQFAKELELVQKLVKLPEVVATPTQQKGAE